MTTDLQTEWPTLDLLVLTFNCAKNLINVPVFASHLCDALSGGDGGGGGRLDLPEIVVFSLQEVAPMTYGFIGTYFLTGYYARFHEALNLAAASILPGSPSPSPYELVHAGNVGYTALLLFARHPDRVRGLQLAEVGFGIAEMGNKGAVGVRFTYVGNESGDEEKETELTFVATHLAAMEWNLPLRNSNWAAIVRGLTFEDPAGVLKAPKREKKTKNTKNDGGEDEDEDEDEDEGEGEGEGLLISSPPTPDPHSESTQRKLHDLSIYRPSSHLFVAGDLNYRISSTSPHPGATLPSLTAAPGSPEHFSNFFPLDQLTRERAAGRTLHGLSEAPVKFPPTYKYTILPPPTALREEEEGGDVPWEFAQHRWPGWTDRILFLDTPAWARAKMAPRVGVVRYEALPVVRSSDHRAVFLRARVPLLGVGAPPWGDGEEGDRLRDPRVRLPVEVDPEAWERRAAARRKEVLVGWSMWLSTTAEGAGLLVGVVVVSVLAWYGYVYVRE